MPGKAEKANGARLICETCGKPAKRLMSPTPPADKGKLPKVSGLLCEDCLAKLEKAYTGDETDLPDAEQQSFR